MRLKNFTLLFIMGFFGLFTTNLFAQDDASIDPANIRYWIGEGDHQVVFAVNWNEPDTALAWGYRFNEESLAVKEVMEAIAEADPRFAYEVGSWGVTNITFNNGMLNLGLAGLWWMYNVNGITAGLGFDVQPVVDGDFIKFGDESCGIITDSLLYTYVWTKEVAAVYPFAEESKIEPGDIRFWIGEGANEAILAVNWAEPDVCYAWGYRFDGENVTVKDMMDAIAAADIRFDYQGGGGMVTDITYNTDEEYLALVGFYWMYNINGGMAWYGYDQQTIVHGDFVKFGDIACATEIAEWTYVWTAPVQPVADNTGVDETSMALRLYPNPATSYTMLDVQMDQATVIVTDLQGRVLNSFVTTQNNEPVRIETSDYEAGVYFVTIKNNDANHTVKLVVK